MRFAFFGDVVGRAGREGLADHLPHLRRALGLEFVIINAENAAAGFGITESTARELFDAGADCLTLGNHSWDQKEALTYIVREPRLIRPLNYPVLADAPGRGANLFETRDGKRIALTRTEFALLQTFMENPRRVLERSWLLNEVWGFEFPTTANSLEVYIGYLRRKTETGGRSRLIHTVRGIGYVLRETPP